MQRTFDYGPDDLILSERLEKEPCLRTLRGSKSFLKADEAHSLEHHWRPGVGVVLVGAVSTGVTSGGTPPELPQGNGQV